MEQSPHTIYPSTTYLLESLLINNDSSSPSNTTTQDFSILVGMHPAFQTLIFTFLNFLTTALGASFIFCTVFFSKLDTSRGSTISGGGVVQLVARASDGIFNFAKKVGIFKTDNASFTNDLFIPLAIGFGGGK